MSTGSMAAQYRVGLHGHMGGQPKLGFDPRDKLRAAPPGRPKRIRQLDPAEFATRIGADDQREHRSPNGPIIAVSPRGGGTSTVVALDLNGKVVWRTEEWTGEDKAWRRNRATKSRTVLGGPYKRPRLRQQAFAAVLEPCSSPTSPGFPMRRHSQRQGRILRLAMRPLSPFWRVYEVDDAEIVSLWSLGAARPIRPRALSFTSSCRRMDQNGPWMNRRSSHFPPAG